MMSASGDSCPVLRKDDKSCRTGLWAEGEKQLLGLLLTCCWAGWGQPWMLLPLAVGARNTCTPWTAQVAFPDVDPA